MLTGNAARRIAAQVRGTVGWTAGRAGPTTKTPAAGIPKAAANTRIVVDMTRTTAPSTAFPNPTIATTGRPNAAAVAARAVDVTKVYGKGEAEVRALDGVDRRVRHRAASPPSWGPSGSGKSTLMHCLAGLDTLTSGAVYVGDTDLSTLNDKQLTQLRRDRIGFIFQAFNLVPTLTALENITLPSALAGRKPDKAWLDHVVDTVGLRDRLKHRPSELSGGQQQRVAVARALAGAARRSSSPTSPPATSTRRTGAEILAFMRNAVRELGQTIVMVTHDPVAASYADRAVFLADGRIVDEIDAPTAESVLDRIKSLGG